MILLTQGSSINENATCACVVLCCARCLAESNILMYAKALTKARAYASRFVLLSAGIQKLAGRLFCHSYCWYRRGPLTCDCHFISFYPSLIERVKQQVDVFQSITRSEV